jgi:hypothetical protein
MSAALKSRLPWWAKVGAKLVLSRLPARYRLWQRLGLFKHGAMEDPAYVWASFVRHWERSDFAGKGRPGFTCLELGPGDTLSSCLLARAHGAATCHLVDSGPFARADMTPYRQLEAWLSGRGLPLPPAACDGDLTSMLRAVGGVYGTRGLASLREIPTASVDWVWSQAVLEHVRLAEFLPTMRELRRVLRTGGVCSHTVDLKDHLGGALNNLRFAEPTWESGWMAGSGFYTNRLRFTRMCELFAEAGFAVEVVVKDTWDALPTPRGKLAAPFAALPDDELRVRGFQVLLRPAGTVEDAAGAGGVA